MWKCRADITRLGIGLRRVRSSSPTPEAKQSGESFANVPLRQTSEFAFICVNSRWRARGSRSVDAVVLVMRHEKSKRKSTCIAPLATLLVRNPHTSSAVLVFALCAPRNSDYRMQNSNDDSIF